MCPSFGKNFLAKSESQKKCAQMLATFNFGMKTRFVKVYMADHGHIFEGVISQPMDGKLQ